MKNNAVKTKQKDNVIIAIRDIEKDEPVIIEGNRLFTATEKVTSGHKIALSEIHKGEPILRYGEPIAKAIEPIHPGQWVHTHNTRPIT
jgi:hypothetical protein